jgi:cyclic pyranopterin phosphate synthase
MLYNGEKAPVDKHLVETWQLDTLDRARFQQITRRDDLGRVLTGIEEAARCGFESVKINAVAVKGLTEEDILPLIRFGRERDIEVRFIEFMPLDAQDLWSVDRVLTADEIISRIAEEFGPATPALKKDPRAPATEYALQDGYTFGVIASVTRPFCMDCNRLRLTADGKLRNCLFATQETDVRPFLSRSDADYELETAIRSCVWSKWAGHEISRSSFVAPNRPMYSIGG